MDILRKLLGAFYRIGRGIAKRCVRLTPLSALGGRHPRNLQVAHIGHGEGQWDIPANLVDKTWNCYSVGVGIDASFESDLATKYGCQVTSFDPTPSAVEHVRSLEPTPFRFVPWGIWTHDGHLDFYSQDTENTVNLSALDSKRGRLLCRVECYTLQTVLRRLGHSGVDLLKIDIEGAWMPVIENFVASGISPQVFCVEFDSPTSIFRVRKAVRLLSRVGLSLVQRRRDNYLFVNRVILESLK